MTCAPIYGSLDAQKKQFRLLEIEPSQDLNLPAKCAIRTVQVGDAPPYRALSYVWGDRSHLCEITINNIQRQVTQNLATALRYIRDYTRSVVLWADAICINQDDIEERSQQIKIMRDIYCNAEKVVVWAGEEDEDTIYAINIFREWDRQIAKVGGNFYEALRIDCLPSELFAESVLDSLSKLLFRSIWSRVWIFQEVVSAHKGCIKWGKTELDFEMVVQVMLEFSGISDMVFKVGHLSETQLKKVHMLQLIENMANSKLGPAVMLAAREAYQHPDKAAGGAFKLSNLLRITRELRATDPRDKIFALMGIAQDSESLVSINYATPIHCLYRTLAANIMREEKNVNLLSYAIGSSSERAAEYTLPSWVPDWPNIKPQFLPNDGQYNASFHLDSLLRFNNDATIMYVYGEMVDRVKTIRAPNPKASFCDFWEAILLPDIASGYWHPVA
jgi:hypothetical protein